MMISYHDIGFKKTEPLQMTEFVRLKRDSKIKMKERKTVEDEPPPPEKRPPPPVMQTQKVQVTQHNAPKMEMPSLNIPLQTSRFNNSALAGVSMAAEPMIVSKGSTAISTNIIPLSKIDPIYPMRAKSRRIEGWVKIEFTITQEGTVANTKVVEYKPSKIFNHSALRAIKRWKFKPKVVNGVAIEQRAVQILTFRLKK